MKEVIFSVEGTPRPKGSFRAMRGRFVIPGSKHQKGWENAIKEAAYLAMSDEEQFEKRPLRVDVVFAFKRPLSDFNKFGLKTGASLAPTKKPDVDKIVRTLGDALTDVVYGDDSWITCINASKVWAEPGSPEGVCVRVMYASEEDIRGASVAYEEELFT